MSEGTPSERPTTFAQAFAQDVTASESLPDTPSTPDAPADPASADAIDPPAEPTSAEVTPAPVDAAGPIPFKDHKRVLDGAYKERDTFKSEVDSLKQRYAWAEQVSPQEIQQLQQWGKAFTTDPVGWLSQSITEVGRTHPHLVPSLRSEAARILGGRNAAPEPEADIEPDVPVLDQNGQVVTRTFSAERAIAMARRAAAEARDEVLKKLAPIQATFEQQQAQRQAHEALQQVREKATSIYQFASENLPDFKALENEIKQHLSEMNEVEDDSRALTAAWRKAYTAKLTAEAKTRDTANKSQVLDDLKTKAGAAIRNPASAAVPSTSRPKSFHDASLSW